jgi:hypothetical protein
MGKGKIDKYEGVPLSSLWKQVPPREMALHICAFDSVLLSAITPSDIISYLKRDKEKAINLRQYSNLSCDSKI